MWSVPDRMLSQDQAPAAAVSRRPARPSLGSDDYNLNSSINLQDIIVGFGPLIVIHYHEVGLKKGNRDYFENRLCPNIAKS